MHDRERELIYTRGEQNWLIFSLKAPDLRENEKVVSD